MTRLKAVIYAQVVLQPLGLLTVVGFNSVLHGLFFLMVMEGVALFLSDDFFPEPFLSDADMRYIMDAVRPYIPPPPLPKPADRPPGSIGKVIR